MHLTHLKLKNFFLFDDVELDLGPRPFFITGQNNDEISATSNGSGKSLLCSSIVWCLFDQLLRKKVRKDDVIGPSDDWCMVEVGVWKDGQDIVVRRYRNHPEKGHAVELFQDGEDISQHKDNEAEIEKILDINASTVFYCAYTDKKTEPIVSLTPGSLKKAVAEIINTQRFDDYLKVIRKKRRVSEGNLESKTALLGEVEANLEDKTEKLKQQKSKVENFERVREEDRMNKKAELAELKIKLAEIRDALKNSSKIEEKWEELLEETNAVEELNAKKKRFQKAKDDSHSKVLHHQKRLNEIDAELSEVESAWSNIYHNSEGVCTYCGNHLASSEMLEEIGQDLQDKKDLIVAKRIDAETDLQAAQVDLEEQKEKLAAIDEELEEAQAAVKEFRKFDKKMQAVRKLRDKESKLDNRIELTLKEIDSITDRQPPTDMIDHLEKEIGNLKSRKTEFKRQCGELSQKIEDYTLLEDCVDYIKVSSYNGFIYTLLDLLEENLDEMTDGDFQVGLEESKGELSFVFTQASKDGKFLPYSTFSTGEQVRIAKAASTSLEQMLDVGFVIDDEGLIGVDDAGLANILDFVLEKNQGKTFFFVGHQKAMKDHFDMCDNIHIVKSNGISQAVVRDG